MKTQASQHGITLVELAVVVAITAILVGTAAPSLSDFIGLRRLEGAATQLATDIQFVRTDTVARNQPLRISFFSANDGSCYLIHTGPAAQCSCTASGAAQCSGDALALKAVQLPSRDRVSVAANAASILFDPLHGTSTPTATVRVVGPQDRAIHHVVNVMGRVRSCSPQATMPGYRAC